MSEKATTAQQELFLDYLFGNDPDTMDDTMASCIAAGYENGSHAKLVRRLKDEIIHRTNERLAMVAPKAVTRLAQTLDATRQDEKGELRLKAAESILDRIGAAKKNAIEIVAADVSPLFFMPVKMPIQYTEESKLEATMTEDDYID